jgi:NAD(P)H dehydrogenase (quinone)
MNILVIYAHPSAQSFNHSILETFAKPFKAKGHTLVVRDLYGIRFDPVLSAADLDAINRGSARLDIVEEQRHVKEADLIAFIYPVWWFSEPAILKGWIDRVLAMGFAFKLHEDKPVGLLTGKKAVVFRTCGAGEALFNTGLRAAMETAFEQGTLHSCGIETVLTRFLYTVDRAAEPERLAMLQQVRKDAEGLAEKS